MDQIELHIHFGESVAETLDFFEEMELIEFQDVKQTNRFLRMYSELSNNSRMWVNAGYTPVELRDGAV